jgi:hypothetical protein
MMAEGGEGSSTHNFERDFVLESWGCNMEGSRTNSSGKRWLTEEVEVARAKLSSWVMDVNGGNEVGWSLRVQEFICEIGYFELNTQLN